MQELDFQETSKLGGRRRTRKRSCTGETKSQLRKNCLDERSSGARVTSETDAAMVASGIGQCVQPKGESATIGASFIVGEVTRETVVAMVASGIG